MIKQLRNFLLFILIPIFLHPVGAQVRIPVYQTSEYLHELKHELIKEWPHNRTINLVFHGHSVPAGYFKTPQVSTLEAYPQLLLRLLKEQYPSAVINVIITAIGGEHSEQGAKRFDHEVLNHQPDILFIDYALNDRNIGLDRALIAWRDMIQKAMKQNVKVILVTPSPDQRVNLLDPDNILEQHAHQIRQLATELKVGLADVYQTFKGIAISNEPLTKYMSQVNHPNEKGHQLIADALYRYFQ